MDGQIIKVNINKTYNVVSKFNEMVKSAPPLPPLKLNIERCIKQSQIHNFVFDILRIMTIFIILY